MAGCRKKQWDVKFPKIEWTHAFTMCSTTLKKIFTDKTPPSETAEKGTTPMTVHVHKSESSKVTQVKQSKQTEEPT